MTNPGFGRRDFLKGAVVGGAAATSVVTPQTAESAEASSNAAAPAPQGYALLNIDERPSSKRWSTTRSRPTI